MTRHRHHCWPYSVAGVLRAGCSEHFGQRVGFDQVWRELLASAR